MQLIPPVFGPSDAFWPPARPFHIRPVTPADHVGMMAVIEALGLFPPNELAEMDDLLTTYFGGSLGDGHTWSAVFNIEDSALIGVAYYAPERMTYGTWNLYLIGIHPSRQGTGVGAALVQHVEHELASRGERILLVETSGMPSFAAQRAFYVKCGYDEEARIREFYQAGDDKVIFRKKLVSLASDTGAESTT